MSVNDPNQDRKIVRFADFLESSPPDTQVVVTDLAVLEGFSEKLNETDIHLPCSTEKCEGKGSLAFQRFTGQQSYLERNKSKLTFETYRCRNCRRTLKTFAIAVELGDSGPYGTALKLGETPAFGPRTPARVIKLIGPDRETFLRGRLAENRGLGIGAFAYYRRVVENQKGRIISEMAKVAEKLGATEADLKLFEAAAKETQFKTAIEMVKAAIPSALRIDQHNPLTLLHTALSDGLHERSDEECLECAREIRLVLTELAERMAQLLKQKSELNDAVSKLLSRTSKKPPAPPASDQ